MAFLLHLFYFLVGQLVLTILLYMLSYILPKAACLARTLAAYNAMVVSASIGAIASIVLGLLGKRQIAQWFAGRVFKYAMLLGTGITFEVIDPEKHLERTRPAVFVGNHQTELDVLMLGCMFPKYCSVTAKKSLRNFPFLGWFMRLSGTVFIDRANAQDARAAMSGAVQEIITKRQSVYMFPEGTRSYSKEPKLLPFKKGAFHLAIQAGVPIVPVVVANYSHILHAKSLVFNSGIVPCKVLDPIPTTGLSVADVDELTRSTREVMLQELVALTEMARNRAIRMSVTTGGNAVKTSANSTSVHRQSTINDL